MGHRCNQDGATENSGASQGLRDEFHPGMVHKEKAIMVFVLYDYKKIYHRPELLKNKLAKRNKEHTFKSLY